MRSKRKNINPEMLLTFIKTEYGQNQIQKFKRGAAQTGLLLEDFDQLFIPSFSGQFQEQIRTMIQSAHDTMVKGDEVYSSAKYYLLLELHFDPVKHIHKGNDRKTTVRILW